MSDFPFPKADPLPTIGSSIQRIQSGIGIQIGAITQTGFDAERDRCEMTLGEYGVFLQRNNTTVLVPFATLVSVTFK